MKLLQYTRVVLECGLYILWENLFFHHKAAKHPEKYTYKYLYDRVRKLVKFVLKCFHVDYHVTGLENFINHEGKVFIVSNHLSDLDPLIMIALSDRPMRFVAKIAAFDFPFVGIILKLLQCYSIDKDNMMSQVGEIKKIVRSLKDENEPDIVIFAEGKRNRQPETHCLDMYPQSIKMSYMGNVDIIRVSHYGTFRVLTTKCYLKRYPIFFDFSKPYKYSDNSLIDPAELTKEIQHKIDDIVDSFRTLDRAEIYKQKISLKRKSLETIVDGEF